MWMCIYVFSLFISQWTCRLFPCLSYYIKIPQWTWRGRYVFNTVIGWFCFSVLKFLNYILSYCHFTVELIQVDFYFCYDILSSMFSIWFFCITHCWYFLYFHLYVSIFMTCFKVSSDNLKQLIHLNFDINWLLFLIQVVMFLALIRNDFQLYRDTLCIMLAVSGFLSIFHFS